MTSPGRCSGLAWCCLDFDVITASGIGCPHEQSVHPILRWCHVNLLPIFTSKRPEPIIGQWRGRWDWRFNSGGRSRGERRTTEGERRRKRRRRSRNGPEMRSPEKPQIARGLIDEEQVRRMLDLPNVGKYLIIITGCVWFLYGLIRVGKFQQQGEAHSLMTTKSLGRATSRPYHLQGFLVCWVPGSVAFCSSHRTRTGQFCCCCLTLPKDALVLPLP